MPQQLSPPTPLATPSQRACRVYERRVCELSSSCKPIGAWGKSELSWTAAIRDVSQGGIRLALRRRFEPGAGLEIALPTGVEGESYSVVVRVVHVVREEGGGWLLGCKFVSELSDEEIERLLPPEPPAAPVIPGQAAPPQGADPTCPRQTLCGVHIRLETLAGTLLDCPIRRLNVPPHWPPTAGKVLTFFALADAGPLPATRVEVIDCTAQGEGWLLRCRVLGTAPAAPATSA